MLSQALPAHEVCLVEHGGSHCPAISRIDVRLWPQRAHGWRFDFRLFGDLAALRIPPMATSQATDGLWQHTCFEVFAALDGEAGYREFNFSPSTQWAAYAFSAYRQRQAWLLPTDGPEIVVSQFPDYLEVSVPLAGTLLPAVAPGRRLCFGLSAVVEARDGKHSYWALAHPAGPPDFHHRAGFQLVISP